MYEALKLPYAFDELEPYIDAETLGIHYELIYKKYINNLNNLLKEINFQKDYTLVELVEHIDEIPIKIRGKVLYNLGGILNHNLYWLSMSPFKNKIPVLKLKEAIDNQFGSFENFKQAFIDSASLLEGSGYTFLVINENGELEIINTPNQETPYIYGVRPIMALDLWEHAYYLLYQNRRNEYIENFFNIVDFKEINKLYEELL